MTKKVVFFDIDDTVFRPGIGIPESAAEGIKKLRENGHLAVICTGRSRAMIFKSILDIGFDGIVAGAGTYVEICPEMNADMGCGNVKKELYRWDMLKEKTDEVVKMMLECGFGPIPEGHDNLYYDENNKEFDYVDFFDRYYGELHDIMKPIEYGNMTVSKVSGRFLKNSDAKRMTDRFKNEYTIIDHHGRLLELIPEGFSKAKGIEMFINELDISREDTFAFGDSDNDIEMLSFVGCGIAMGNASDKLKECARHITADIGDDGIYKGLKYFELI